MNDTQNTRIGRPQMKILKAVIADMEKRQKRNITSVEALEKIFTEWMDKK